MADIRRDKFGNTADDLKTRLARAQANMGWSEAGTYNRDWKKEVADLKRRIRDLERKPLDWDRLMQDVPL